VLRPGGGYRNMILLEEVSPVVHGHGTTILRDRIDPIAESHLLPGPGDKVVLHVVSPVLGQVDERTGRLKSRQELEFHLGHIGLVVGLDGRIQLVVFRRACSHILQLDLDVGVSTVPQFYRISGTWNPVPKGQGYRPTRGTAALRTGAPTTGGQGSQDHQQNAHHREFYHETTYPTSREKIAHCLVLLWTRNSTKS